MAAFARRQAATVAENINALSRDERPGPATSRWVSASQCRSAQPAGLVSSPDRTGLSAARPFAELKGRDLMVERFSELFGLAKARAQI